MKNLNLENLSVQEMDTKEMSNVTGGFWPLIIGGIIALAALVASKDVWVD